MSGLVRARLTLVLVSSLLLLGARMALLYVLGREAWGEASDALLWRIAGELPEIALHSLAAGGLAVLGAALFGRAKGAAGLPAAALVVAALVFGLSGWPIDDPYRVAGLPPGGRRTSLAFLSVAALLGAWLLVRLSSAAGSMGRLGRALRSRTSPAVALVLALAAPLLFVQSLGSAPTRTVRLRVLEIPFEPELWHAVQQRPDEPVGPGVLTPSLDYRIDGGDLPALVMPPPAEVRFTVPSEPPGLLLRAAAGAEHRSVSKEAGREPVARVGFQIEVDGHTVLDEQVELGTERMRDQAWRRLPEAGVRLPPGALVVLRTTLELDGPAALGETPVVQAGFGELVLERDVERPRARATRDTPNVVLIVMDTLRADRMSCYGYSIETTPNLDALAARGLVFDEAFATSSWTWPATASILTGLLPEAHGVVSDGACYLDGRIASLPKVLGERGYTTAAFSCNPLIVPDKNFDQGFETFDSTAQFRKTDRILESVRSWLRLHGSERFFLYLHLVDPHWIYEPSPEAVALVGLGEPPPLYPERGLMGYHGQLLRGVGHAPDGTSILEEILPPGHRDHMNRAYDAAVFTSDQFVGQILDTLSSLGLDDRTIVVFTSDHGEELLDHGQVTHGISLYRELTRAPLILAGPGIPVGRVATRVSNRHIAPTLAAFAGAEIPGLERQGGRKGLLDLAGPILLYDPENIPVEPILFSTHQGWWKGAVRVEIYGMIEDDWEVHYAPRGRPWGAERDSPPGDLALYHLPSDPEQHRDLAHEHPERARDMVERMMRHHRLTEEASSDLRLGVGGAGADLLRHIGYIGAEEEEPARSAGNDG